MPLQKTSRQTKIQSTSDIFCLALDFIAMQSIIMKAIKHMAENHTVSISFSF